MDIVYAGYIHLVEVGQEHRHGLCRRSLSFKVGQDHGHGLCTIFFFIQRRWSQEPAVTSPQPEDDHLQCVMSSSSVSWCRRFCQRELQPLLMTDLAAAAGRCGVN